jgi:hypothetical protein
MPDEDGFRVNDVNRRAPAVPRAREPCPEHPIDGCQTETEGRDRFTTASWCRSAMISRCSETRDRTRNRSEWSSEKTTETTRRGYLRTYATSIDATRTVFSAATAVVVAPPRSVGPRYGEPQQGSPAPGESQHSVQMAIHIRRGGYTLPRFPASSPSTDSVRSMAASSAAVAGVGSPPRSRNRRP